MSMNYSSIYDVFGGEGATNDLIATFRSMGLDDATIDSVLTPYIPASTAAPPGALSQATSDNSAQAATSTTASTVSDADILGWFNANPGADDTLIATTMRDAGVSPDRLATVLNVDAGEVASRYDAALNISTGSSVDSNATTGALAQAVAEPVKNTTSDTRVDQISEWNAPVDLGDGTFMTPGGTVIGGDGRPISQTQDTSNSANNSITSTIQLAGQTYNIDNAAVQKVKDQILAQGTTSKWTGEGFGSAEANAEAMAKQLVANGVTDISQVAKIDQKVDVTVTPRYEYYNTGQVDGDGQPIMGATLVGYQDKDGKEVDAALVKPEYIDNGDGATLNYVAPIGTKTVIGNKDTGKAFINDYGERGGVGDAWSGTYSGKGNTAFRTAFDANGKPIFYTTGGFK